MKTNTEVVAIWSVETFFVTFLHIFTKILKDTSIVIGAFAVFFMKPIRLIRSLNRGHNSGQQGERKQKEFHRLYCFFVSDWLFGFDRFCNHDRDRVTPDSFLHLPFLCEVS